MSPPLPIRRKAIGTPGNITIMNEQIERNVTLNLTHETMIEQWWTDARRRKDDGPAHWLLLARIAEVALLCAGNYADNCEIEAAGDFLVNPREIIIREKQSGRTVIKNRHGRLSTQFGLGGSERKMALKRFFSGVALEVTKLPLLPQMAQVLADSGCISSFYLNRFKTGRRQIADTLTFLAAWPVSDVIELKQRLEAATPQEREFVESCLCRFDLRVFHQIGTDLRYSLEEPGLRSAFLTESRMPNDQQWEKFSISRLSALDGSRA